MDPDPDPRKEIEVDPDPDLDPERGLKWIRIRPNAVDPDPKRWFTTYNLKRNESYQSLFLRFNMERRKFDQGTST